MTKISAILVAYNEEKDIGKTIDSLLAQSYKDFEIIIVNNASTDKTAEVAGKYTAKIISVDKNRGPGGGRNFGAAHATGEIIAFLDGHILTEPDLFANAVRLFDTYRDVGAWGGPTLTPKDDPFFAQACGIVLGSWPGTFAMSNRYKKGELNANSGELFVTSANFFIRRTDFEKTSGFALDMYGGDDPEFFERLSAQGTKIGYSPDLFVYNKRRTKLKLFCKQFFNYGKVRPIKEKLHKKIPELQFWLPSIFLLYLATLPATALASYFAFMPLLIYFAAITLYSIFSATRQHIISASLLLPILYFSLHISYGSGFVYGLYKSAQQNLQKNEVISIAR